MLQTLHVRNMGVIQDICIDFSSGLTCLSGETGAGKSLLVDSIKILLGERPEGWEIRAGQQEAMVQGVFSLTKEEAKPFIDAGYEPEDNQIILRRTIHADGRTRAWIQGVSTTIRQLRQLAQQLVGITGQHAFLSLQDPLQRLHMLDTLGKTQPLLADVQGHVENLKEAQQSLHRHETLRANAIQRAAFVEHAISELQAAQIQPGQLQDLQHRVRAMEHAQQLLQEAHEIHGQLYETQESAFDIVQRSLQTMGFMASLDERLTPLHQRLDTCRIELREIARDISSYGDQLELDPTLLSQSQLRLENLRTILRRFGPTEEDALKQLGAFQEEYETLQTLDDTEDKLKKHVVHCETIAMQAAEQLSQKRIKGAKELSEQVTFFLQKLAMEKATFLVQRTKEPLSITGIDAMDFLVETNPGEGAGPVTSVASGGELSRITLALYGVISAVSGVSTLVYDEIDAGLSSHVADRIGAVLKSVSSNRQILVVTHHASVAARADQHLKVSKQQEGERTIATIEQLDTPGRIEEIARMLSGSHITSSVLTHAKELLQRSRSAATGAGYLDL